MNLESYLKILKNTAKTINNVLGENMTNFNECYNQGPLLGYTYMKPNDPIFHEKIYIDLNFSKIYTCFGDLQLCTSMSSKGPDYNSSEKKKIIKKLNLKIDNKTFSKYNYTTSDYEKDSVYVMKIDKFGDWHTSTEIRKVWEN